MTTTMDQIKNIRNMYFEQGMNISEIAAATKFNWKTVQKYVDMEDFNEKKKSIYPNAMLPANYLHSRRSYLRFRF